MNSYESSDLFWTRVNEVGKLSIYFFFVKLKFRNNSRIPKDKQGRNPFNDTKLNKEYFDNLKSININADLTGGFVKETDLYDIAKQIGYSYSTTKSYLNKLVKENLATRTHTGWLLTSMKKAAENLGVDLKRLRLKANTKSELKQKHAYNTLRRIKFRKDRITHETGSSMPVIISCKTLSTKLGFKSSATGLKRERELESKNRLAIKRFPTQRKYGRSLICEYVFKKPCNELTILKQVR